MQMLQAILFISLPCRLTFLQANLSLVCRNRPDLCFLLPLCGKTRDLKFLYDLGHSVIGIEAMEKAAQEFFDEHKLEAKKRDVQEGVCVYEVRK